MHAMIRRYQMGAGTVSELMHTVDTQFADQLGEQLGLLGYLAVDTGDSTIMTVTLLPSEQAARRAEAAAEGVRQALGAFRVESLAAFTGEVMVSRAAAQLLRPLHH